MSDRITVAVEIDERELETVKGGSGQCTNNLKQIGLAVHNYADAGSANPLVRTREATAA